MKKIAIEALGRAAATTAYVALVATFLSHAEQFFGREEGKSVLIPIFMLLLFLISATITSFLVLGKPVMLYHAGEKKTAFTFLFATIGWLFCFLILVGIIMASMG